MDKIRQLLESRAIHSLILMKLRSVSLLAKFALTLFIAKFIGFEALGQYGLITGLTFIIPVLLGFSLGTVLSRKAVTQTPQEIATTISYYVSYAAALYGGLSFFVIGAGVATDQLILFLTVYALVFLSQVNQDIYNLMLNLSQALAANVLLFLRAALWIGLYILTAFFMPELRTMEAVLLSWIAGEFCALLGFIFIVRGWPWGAITREVSLLAWFKQEFKNARTLYMNGIAYSLSQYSDRYIISWLLGLELTGVYVLFWSIGSALCNLVRTGVVQYSRPSLVRAYTEKSASYRAMFETCLKNTLMVSTAMAVGTGIFMYFLLPYLNKPLAIEWMPVLWLVLLAFIITMITEVWGLVFYSQHRDMITFGISCFTMVASVIFNLTLVPFIGLWGTGIALILTMLGTLGIQILKGKKLLDITRSE